MRVELVGGYTPEPHFRAFETDKFARDFATGQEIRITTLEICRRMEGSRRDAGEGIHRHLQTYVSGSGDDPQVAKAARRMGIPVGGANSHVELSDNELITVLPDAWVLCLFARLDSAAPGKFGPFVARVQDPYRLFVALTEDINREHPLAAAFLGHVTYAPRRTRDSQEPAGLPGFVKDPDKYADEQEVRMLWIPRETLTSDLPVLMRILPSAAGCCELMPKFDVPESAKAAAPHGAWAFTTRELRARALALSEELRALAAQANAPLPGSQRIGVAELTRIELDALFAADVATGSARLEACRRAYEERFRAGAIELRDAMLHRMLNRVPHPIQGRLSVKMHWKYDVAGGNTVLLSSVADDLRLLAESLPRE